MGEDKMINKAAAAYREGQVSKKETVKAFLDSTLYPKILEAAREGESKVVLELPDELTTVASLNSLVNALASDGLGYTLSGGPETVTLKVFGWVEANPKRYTPWYLMW